MNSCGIMKFVVLNESFAFLCLKRYQLVGFVTLGTCNDDANKCRRRNYSRLGKPQYISIKLTKCNNGI